MFVLTNDDGFDAPGLKALWDVLNPLQPTVVVAPRRPHSAMGHAVSLRRPMALERVSANWYRLDGTPADCVRVALHHLRMDPSCVFAGINPGANLGTDAYHSGTVAAAREAAIYGFRGIAVSQYICRDQSIDWPASGHHAGRVIAKVLSWRHRDGRYWNINLPSPLTLQDRPAIGRCRVERQPQQLVFQSSEQGLVCTGNIHQRPRTPGRDVAVCFGGRISVSGLNVEVT